MARCLWCPITGVFHQLSRRGGVGGRSYRPDPTRRLCDHTAPPAGQTALPQQHSQQLGSLSAAAFKNMLMGRTIGIIGVRVSVRGVPALNGAIDPPTEALFTTGAHGDTQHSTTTRRQKGGIMTTSINTFLTPKLLTFSHLSMIMLIK